MPTAKTGVLHSCEKGLPMCQSETIAISIQGGREEGEEGEREERREEGRKEGWLSGGYC